jgi:hypothetical protein
MIALISVPAFSARHYRFGNEKPRTVTHSEIKVETTTIKEIDITAKEKLT